MKFCKYVSLRVGVHCVLMNEHAHSCSFMRLREREQENGTNTLYYLLDAVCSS